MYSIENEMMLGFVQESGTRYKGGNKEDVVLSTGVELMMEPLNDSVLISEIDAGELPRINQLHAVFVEHLEFDFPKYLLLGAYLRYLGSTFETSTTRLTQGFLTHFIEELYLATIEEVRLSGQDLTDYGQKDLL